MSEQTIKEMLKMIDAKIEHIEDITADNRAIIIKLVKQGNSIVKFLSKIDIQEVSDDLEDMMYPDKTEYEGLKSNKIQELKELVEEFMDKEQDLQEFEEELEKNKDKLTPGTIGES